MESPDDLPITLWDLEPGRAAVLRSPDARQRVPTRFMESEVVVNAISTSPRSPIRFSMPQVPEKANPAECNNDILIL